MTWRHPDLDDPHYGYAATRSRIEEKTVELVEALEAWATHDREDLHAAYVAAARITTVSRSLAALTAQIANLNHIEMNTSKT